MKKFYCFRAGQELPKWMWKVKPRSRESWFKSKNGKVTFGVSCVVVREDGEHSKIMIASNGYCQVHVKGFHDCAMGGVDGASGVSIRSEGEQSGFGNGVKYIITNSTVREVK